VQAVDDFVGDAVAVVLAIYEVAGELGALGIVHHEVAQQHGRTAPVAARLLEQLEHVGGPVGGVQQRHGLAR
jgi:hypothetical protein